MVIRLNRHNDVVDAKCFPLASCPTVASCVSFLSGQDLPLYVEAQFSLLPDAPVSIDRQMAAKVRRLRKIASGLGRAVVRIDATPGMTHYYTALLAR